MFRARHILISALAGAVLHAAAPAAPPPPKPAARNVPGSKARQLLLKQALEKESSGTLVAELNRNKKSWSRMNPEQKRQLRERYLAYLKEDPDTQEALIAADAQLQRLTGRQRRILHHRQDWLTRVVARLTPAQRRQLKALPQLDRARRLLELKAKLLDGPTTRPAAAPTTRPAGKE